MTICHFTTVHKLYDTRVFYKECMSLVNLGYKVILVGNHIRNEMINGVQIDPLPQYKSRVYSMIVKPWHAFRKCMEHKADIYHFHDPELIPVAILLRILGKKVIYDVHEDVPKDILDKEWIQSTILKKTFSALAEIAEFVADNAMSGVVVVTEPIGNRFNNSNKILLRNLPVLSIMDKIRAENRTAHEKLIIYIGGLTRIRGIREIIQAMEHINARMWIIGEWDDPTYEELCKKEKGAEKVEFYGFLKPVQAFAKLKAADAAIVNFLPAHNHTFALPNKPFEYMACGIPFVMSDFEYWQSIFSDYALFADPTDPLKIASQLNRILNDPELHKKLSESGRKAVETELCWEKEVVKLDDLYRQLGG